MALDLAKYRKLFLEEAAEHLSEISSALLRLEKDAASTESIDAVFRMAHSTKSMAASLEYDSIAQLAHALEDRMEHVRRRGHVADGVELSALFQGLEGLEAMVAVVRETGEPPPPRPDLADAIRAVQAAPAAAAVETPSQDALKKKLLRTAP